jgi:phosphoribosylamine---glycine ligase
MSKLNILLLGSGGREHAFAWKIEQSHLCKKLFIAPGNGGTGEFGENVPLLTTDFGAIKIFVLDNKIDMVVVGPEDPLVKGITNYFSSDNELTKIPVIGPTKEGAELEGSKAFAKAFMKRHNIPTAAYDTFDAKHITNGLDYIEEQQIPIVLKADGLAAGKGVLICNTKDDAKHELTLMLNQKKFGDAGNTVVIEQFLKGIELSVFILTDGKNYKILPTAKDYKRVGEGDTGLNTGGMGAVSPVPFCDDKLMKKIEERIIKPTIAGLLKENILYKGFLYFGLINVKDDPFVIEYNCRMGDPETEVVIPRIKSDLVELFEHVANNTMDKATIEIDERAATTIVLTSGGYPGSFSTGYEITGLDAVSDSVIFHAGTKNNNEKIVTSGGRVITVTSLGTNIPEALRTSLRNTEKIHFKNKYYRKDIGFDLKATYYY